MVRIKRYISIGVGNIPEYPPREIAADTSVDVGELMRPFFRDLLYI